MNAALQEAIEELYCAFSDISKPSSIEACPCCFDPGELSQLLTKPLRDLTPDELSKYASKALNTAGTPQDFRYFLPRIMEILISDSGWWPDVEVVSGKIAKCELQAWPQPRRQAIITLFDRMISDILAQQDDWNDLDSWICSLGHLPVDLGPFLNRIAENRFHLISFYERNSQPLIKGRLSNSFWDEAPEGEKQVLAWFASSQIRKAIDKAYGLS